MSAGVLRQGDDHGDSEERAPEGAERAGHEPERPAGRNQEQAAESEQNVTDKWTNDKKSGTGGNAGGPSRTETRQGTKSGKK
jgi:hypothetical protein